MNKQERIILIILVSPILLAYQLFLILLFLVLNLCAYIIGLCISLIYGIFLSISFVVYKIRRKETKKIFSYLENFSIPVYAKGVFFHLIDQIYIFVENIELPVYTTSSGNDWSPDEEGRPWNWDEDYKKPYKY